MDIENLKGFWEYLRTDTKIMYFLFTVGFVSFFASIILGFYIVFILSMISVGVPSLFFIATLDRQEKSIGWKSKQGLEKK